jgi:hypothetical protein
MALGGVERNLGHTAGALGALVFLGTGRMGFVTGFVIGVSVGYEENADGGGVVPGIRSRDIPAR